MFIEKIGPCHTFGELLTFIYYHIDHIEVFDLLVEILHDETYITDNKGVSIHFDIFLNAFSIGLYFGASAFFMEVTLTLRKKCGKNGKGKVMNGMVF